MSTTWIEWTGPVDPVLPDHRFRHQAMNTDFEVVLDHSDPTYAAQAARALFDQLDHLEGKLSRFRESSEISRLNRSDVGTPVRLGPDAFDCLVRARDLFTETSGAFDVSLGTDFPSVELDPSTLSARRNHADTRVDLGGIGKGYALDQLVGVLADWDINRACLIGGGSSVLALEPPSGLPGWPVGIGTGSGATRIQLCRASLGASGTGAQGEHIMDPFEPDRPLPARRTWVCSNSAARSDALSTAFMVLPESSVDTICQSAEPTAALIEHYENGGTRLSWHGSPALTEQS